MAITSAQYANAANMTVKVVYDDGRPTCYVPVDAANQDYNELVAWDAQPGNDISAFGG